jgi:hypothetical protein
MRRNSFARVLSRDRTHPGGPPGRVVEVMDPPAFKASIRAAGCVRTPTGGYPKGKVALSGF